MSVTGPSETCVCGVVCVWCGVCVCVCVCVCICVCCTVHIINMPSYPTLHRTTLTLQRSVCVLSSHPLLLCVWCAVWGGTVVNWHHLSINYIINYTMWYGPLSLPRQSPFYLVTL